METYKPWDFCRSINCNSMIRPEEQRKVLTCPNCKAYQMHDYLRGKGSIIEEDSKPPKQIEWLESEVNRLQVALDATIKEKERCQHECQRAQSLATENFNNWQKSATDSIDLVAVMERDGAEFVKLQAELEQLRKVRDAAEAVVNEYWDLSQGHRLDLEEIQLLEALTQAKEVSK